jgi:glycosyltransferase involved in cell wall biosynthesis
MRGSSGAMKIGLMSAWNLDAGPSVHAELVGREWIRMGHNLAVYSFHRSDFHGTTFVGEDEDYVFRCFGTQKGLDPRPILKSGFEFFIAEDLCMLPKDDLGKIFRHIRARSKTVNIMHDAELSDNPSFYQFDWDAVVCFDDRYRSFLSDVYPERMIHVIPFPCRPVSRGDKVEARRSLGLPLERRLLLVFGQHVKDDLRMLPVISRLGRDYPITLLVVSRGAPDSIIAENVQIVVRRESPDVERLYCYLHAADTLLLHRETAKKAVVSSTAHQCLGSGCPIIAFDSPFFEYFDEEVLKYRCVEEFEASLTEVLTDGEKVKRSLRAAEEYVKRNSASRIAERFIELFNRL